MLATASATLRTPLCRVCCTQYVVSSALTNAARFFLPTLLKEVYPTLSPWRIGLIFTVPAAIKVGASPLVAGWADRGGHRRRFRTAWALYGAAAVLLLMSGLGMTILLHGSAAATRSARSSRQGAAISCTPIGSRACAPHTGTLHTGRPMHEIGCVSSPCWAAPAGSGR